jgi:hypothetical protein
MVYYNPRDDIGHRHTCQKCKPTKFLLALLASVATIALIVSVVFPKQVIVVTKTEAIYSQTTLQISVSSITISNDAIDYGKGEDTIRTGGQY